MNSTLLQAEEIETYQNFLRHITSRPVTNKQALLASIPNSQPPSYGPLTALSCLLSRLSGPWPVLPLQQTYSRLWRQLPEEAKAGRAPPEALQLLKLLSDQCKQSYSSLVDLLHPTTLPAIIDPQSGCLSTHSQLTATVKGFQLPSVIHHAIGNPVIAISLPNGPLLATAVLAVATYYTAAPVAHGSGVGKQQFRSDVLQSRSHAVIAFAADISRLGLRDTWLAEAGITVFLADLDANMSLVLRDLDDNEFPDDESFDQHAPNTADDVAILLFTSGTSGTKKLVPLSIHALVSGVAMVVESWGLSPTMRCLNQMPLNHVGGLVRNLFAPIFSGGSVICCSAFDANVFWDCVEEHAPTWYYASPSMHQCILETARDRSEAVSKSQIRLVCNAAGGLLPSLAGQLRDAFSTSQSECVVLPSYGMTECMPISTPPLTYRLEKTGTSGISVGPDLAILNGQDEVLPAGVSGRICVRGAPLFAGYLRSDGSVDRSCFTDEGRFDTGDMGYVDDEGYLYINGRSKEVINRGGELISPFEIEEAVITSTNEPTSVIFGKVAKALAFSVKHDVLQEVVGLVVTKPLGSTRPSLRQLQTALKPLISQVKLPVVIVYMDDGLPTNNNKLLRINMVDRLGLPEFSDVTSMAERHFEARCPPANTPLSESVSCRRLPALDQELLKAQCQALVAADIEVYVKQDSANMQTEILLAPTCPQAVIPDVSSDLLLQKLNDVLHGYLVPSTIQQLVQPIPRTGDGIVDDYALERMLGRLPSESLPGTASATESAIIAIFSEVLSVPVGRIAPSSDFFDMGGDSMKAGRLLSGLRKTLQLRLPVDVLFANSSVSALTTVIDEKLLDSKPHSTTATVNPDVTVPTELLPGCEKSYSSTNPLLLILQLAPLMIFWPMRRALTWTIFMYCLAYTQQWPTNASIVGRLFNLVLSMGVGRLLTRTITPFLSIAFKWLVIGRYREGIYPMWGWYHTRWWLCEKVIATAGMGVMSYFNWSRVFYLRLMGARVGKNVTINRGATLGEYDLIALEDNVVLERCKVRPMAPERNTSMYLGRILIGMNASVGLAAIVAPGAVVPAGACIGPNSSSWELEDADEANRELASSTIPGAHWALTLFLGAPLQLITAFIRALPWLACLVALVRTESAASTGDQVREVIIWFASPGRVGFHYAALAANALLGPFFLFAAVVAIKRCFDLLCGRILPGPADSRSEMTKFRLQLIRTLMPAPRLHELTELFGTHYEATSVCMRAIGAKVGKHVYWPGTGPSIQDYDFVEVGDNVVFGSRAHIVTSDGTGSACVRIKDNAMVADRVVLLPGSELGEKTVMGSGALAKKDAVYPSGTTWVGSKKNGAICLSKPTSEAKPDIQDRPSLLAPPPPLSSTFSSYNSSRATLATRTSFDTTRFSDIEKTARPGLGSRMASTDPMVPQTEKGQPLREKAGEQELSPFGRAFHHKLAPYRVWSQLEIFLYSASIAVLTATWWNLGSISAVQIVARLYTDHTNPPSAPDSLAPTNASRPLALYALFLSLTTAIMALQTLLTLAFLVAAKWLLLGRRHPGSHDWDTSPYCQRWQLFLQLERLRRDCHGGAGLLAPLTGTHWLVLYFRAMGASIGADCALFAGGRPSLLLTEPDLVTLGHRVALDDASLVAHINTAGRFALHPLRVGDRAVLRSGSRLLSGAECRADACLLEHTLVMAGDVVEEGCTMQGWPAEEWGAGRSRVPTLGVRRVRSKAE